MSATHSSFGCEAMNALLAHQPRDPIAAHIDTHPTKLPPRLACPVSPPVAGPGLPDPVDEDTILPFPQRRLP